MISDPQILFDVLWEKNACGAGFSHKKTHPSLNKLRTTKPRQAELVHCSRNMSSLFAQFSEV